MTKKLKVEGILDLKMNDKDVQKNIDSLKKLTSELEINSNIDEIAKQIDELRTVDSEVDFNSNLDSILKQVEDIEKIQSELNIDGDFSGIKKQIEQIKNSNVTLDVKAENLQGIKKELDSMKKVTTNVEVKVDRTEWDELKKEWSGKFEISAVAGVVGGAVGASVAADYNEIMKALREKGLSKDDANKIVSTGLDSGYSLQDMATVAQYANKGTLELMSKSEENTKRIIALMVAAERSGQAGADDIARAVQAMKEAGYDENTIMAMNNLFADEIQKGHSEIAEVLREYIPKLQGTELEPTKMAVILDQMNLQSSEDVSRVAGELSTLSINIKQLKDSIPTLKESIDKLKQENKNLLGQKGTLENSITKLIGENKSTDEIKQELKEVDKQISALEKTYKTAPDSFKGAIGKDLESANERKQALEEALKQSEKLEDIDKKLKENNEELKKYQEKLQQAQNMSFNSILDEIKNSKEITPELMSKTGLNYDQLNELKNQLQTVDLNKNLEQSTEKLDEFVNIAEDQKSVLDDINLNIQKWAADKGLLQYGGEAGGILGFLSGHAGELLTGAGGYALGSGKLPSLGKGLGGILGRLGMAGAAWGLWEFAKSNNGIDEQGNLKPDGEQSWWAKLWIDDDDTRKSYEEYQKAAEETKKQNDELKENFKTIFTEDIPQTLGEWKDTAVSTINNTLDDIKSEYSNFKTKTIAELAGWAVDAGELMKGYAGIAVETWNAVIDATQKGINGLVSAINTAISWYNSVASKLGFGKISYMSGVDLSGYKADVNAVTSDIQKYIDNITAIKESSQTVQNVTINNTYYSPEPLDEYKIITEQQKLLSNIYNGDI